MTSNDSKPGQPSQQGGQSFLEQQLNIRHYWHVVLERRWLVLTAFISVMLLSALYLVRAERIYQATVRIQIDRESANVLNIKDVFSIDGREQDYLQTQFKNLQSRTLLTTVAKNLALTNDARYAKAQDIALALSWDLTIAPIRLSRLVDIKTEHSEPKQAQKIANQIAETFIQQNLDHKRSASFNAVTWLKVQADDQRKKVETAERALHHYQTNYNEVSLDENDNIIRQAMQQAQSDLSRVRAESIQLQRVLTEIERGLKEGVKPDTLPEIAVNPVINRLKQEISLQQATIAGLSTRYRHKHPNMIKANEQLATLQQTLDHEISTLIESMRVAAKLAKVREDSVASIVAEEEKKQLNINRLRIEYDVLRRDAENAKAIYNNVLTRLSEMDLTSSVDANNMRIIDKAALPIRPIKPRIVLTLFMGVVGGIVVALSLAFFVSYLDDSVKSQDDIENHLRLPFLGYVPNIKTNSVVERDLQAHLHPQSNAAEGFRTVRATVALTHKPEKLRVLSITSTIPSEGKSLVASNYAIVTAQTGQRTLLVDVDLRRPSVHKAYQLHSPVGLSAYLMGETSRIDDLIHATEVPNLDVICCGAVPSNPSELVGSKRMQQFVSEIRNRYDRVVLDCPPISAVSDPLMIAAMSDGVVFVTKFNKIRRDHARKSIQRIQNAGIHILGVVINDIDFEGKDSYYYSYYYYQNRYYASYKTAEHPRARKGAPEARNDDTVTRA